jgi:hypothetical protein
MKGTRTYGFKRSDFGSVVWGCVVHCHATDFAFVAAVGDLRDAFVGAVSGFEVEVCGPVVGEISVGWVSLGCVRMEGRSYSLNEQVVQLASFETSDCGIMALNAF